MYFWFAVGFVILVSIGAYFCMRKWEDKLESLLRHPIMVGLGIAITVAALLIHYLG